HRTRAGAETRSLSQRLRPPPVSEIRCGDTGARQGTATVPCRALPITIDSLSHLAHKTDAPHSVRCFVVTISDTRTEETDTSGRAIVEILTAAGHQVVGRSIVTDDPALIRDAVARHLASPAVQVVITTGGTGITSRDVTLEAIEPLLEKRLDG